MLWKPKPVLPCPCGMEILVQYTEYTPQIKGACTYQEPKTQLEFVSLINFHWNKYSLAISTGWETSLGSLVSSLLLYEESSAKQGQAFAFFPYRSVRTQIHQLQAHQQHVHEGEGRLPHRLWGGQWFSDLPGQLPGQPVCAARQHHLCSAHGQNWEDKDDWWVGMVGDGAGQGGAHPCKGPCSLAWLWWEQIVPKTKGAEE